MVLTDDQRKTAAGLMKTLEGGKAQLDAFAAKQKSSPSTTPTTTPPTTDTPTSSSTTTRYPRLTQTTDTSKNVNTDYDSIYDSSRQTEIKRQQSQLSGLEQIFNTKLDHELTKEREVSARDMARANTISAMTGNMGGVEATSRAGASDRRGQENEKIIRDRIASEKAAAISALYGQIDQNAGRAAEAKLQTNRLKQTELAKETAKNATNNILAFASHGDWDTFKKSYQDDTELQAEVQRTGKTLPELYELYTANQPAAPKKDYTWKGDNLVVVQTDADGKISTQTFPGAELGIPKGTDFQTMTLGDSVYWVDKNDPFNADGSPKLTRMGAKESTKTGSGSSGFTLNPGQKRYDAGGKLIAEAPAAATKLTATDRQALLTTGFNDTDIDQIQSDVSEHGLDAVLEGISDEKQKEALQKVYGSAEEEGAKFLDKDYMSNLFTDAQLKQAAADAGFRSIWSKWATEKDKYLEYLMKAIEQYRTAGYTDKDILKQLQ